VGRKKNQAAVALGRLGGRARAKALSAERQSEIGKIAGQVGGRRRAEALSAEQRKAIARKAAMTRWANK